MIEVLKILNKFDKIKLLVVGVLSDHLILVNEISHLYLNNSCRTSPTGLCLLHWFPFEIGI